MQRRYKPTGPSIVTVRLIWERAGGCCECCGAGLIWEQRGEPFGWSVQHRINRSQGVNNDPSNLLVLQGGGTTGCHGTVTARSIGANALGLALESWQNPITEPLRTMDQTRWLTNDGHYLYTPPLGVTA
jgi:hypothetical protein